MSIPDECSYDDDDDDDDVMVYATK
jgi:hypothetical protein